MLASFAHTAISALHLKESRCPALTLQQWKSSYTDSFQVEDNMNGAAAFVAENE